jgi:hypothetical protein
LGRILVGGFAILAGVGVLAWNRTQWSLRSIEKINRIDFGRRLAPYITQVMHYGYYVGAVFSIVTGLLAVTNLVT